MRSWSSSAPGTTTRDRISTSACARRPRRGADANARPARRTGCVSGMGNCSGGTSRRDSQTFSPTRSIGQGCPRADLSAGRKSAFQKHKNHRVAVVLVCASRSRSASIMRGGGQFVENGVVALTGRCVDSLDGTTGHRKRGRCAGGKGAWTVWTGHPVRADVHHSIPSRVLTRQFSSFHRHPCFPDQRDKPHHHELKSRRTYRHRRHQLL